MLYAYAKAGSGLMPLPRDHELAEAIWIDLYRPLESQVAAVSALGYQIPTLEDMEEIEISNRLYTDGGTIYMTGVLPGQLPDGENVAMPVTFILNRHRLVTVRHHAPRPFETFPNRADRSSGGATTPERVFLGLVEEIVGRLADLSESVGKELDRTAGQVLSKSPAGRSGSLERALVTIGKQAELMGRVRMGLLSMDRILVYHAGAGGQRSADSAARAGAEAPTRTAATGHEHATRTAEEEGAAALRAAVHRDIQALEVHADFLTSRIAMTIDATMGMIGLQQNERVRILSVVTALFLPPTLIASIYGMNFDRIPALHWHLGFPMALGMMAASVIAVLALLRWRNWL